MKTKLKFLSVFISLAWSTTIAAFNADGINYGVLSESDLTVSVTGLDVDRMAGDIVIPGKVSCDGKEYTVTEISARAFYNCRNITSVDLPSTVQFIGSSAFEYCVSMTAISIPDQTTELGDRAFSRCGQLKDINIPIGLRRLGAYALYNCSGIEELTLPATLTDIAEHALMGCSGLRNINVEDGNPDYVSEDGVLFDHGKTTLMLFPVGSCFFFYGDITL